MTVWLYELLDASMSCGDKKAVQVGRYKYYLRRSVEIFPRLNEPPLATRYIWRATYTCPSVNVMP